MNINWWDLHYFVTIAREKSITRAAQVLHITQPALTSRLKNLEYELGEKLLERSWKGVNLTLEGTFFLVQALKTLREFKGVSIESNQNLESILVETRKECIYKQLKLGITRPLSSTWLPLILTRLNQFDPSLRFDITSEFSNLILELVEFGELHIGIVSYDKPITCVKSIPLFEDEMVLLGPKNDPIPLEEQLKNIDSLLDKPFIQFSPHIPIRKDTDLIFKKLFGILPKNIHEVNDTLALRSMISSGFGYTILPLSFILSSFSISTTSSSEQLYDLLPYNLVKLGSHFQTRSIHIVYSESDTKQSELPVKEIAEDLYSYFNSLSFIHTFEKKQ